MFSPQNVTSEETAQQKTLQGAHPFQVGNGHVLLLQVRLRFGLNVLDLEAGHVCLSRFLQTRDVQSLRQLHEWAPWT